MGGDEKVATLGKKWKIPQQPPPEHKKGDRRVIITDLFAETKRQLTLRNTSLKLFYQVRWNPSQLVFQLSGNPGRNTNTSSSSSNIYSRLKCSEDRKGEIKRSTEVDRTWDEWMFLKKKWAAVVLLYNSHSPNRFILQGQQEALQRSVAVPKKIPFWLKDLETQKAQAKSGLD